MTDPARDDAPAPPTKLYGALVGEYCPRCHRTRPFGAVARDDDLGHVCADPDDCAAARDRWLANATSNKARSER